MDVCRDLESVNREIDRRFRLRDAFEKTDLSSPAILINKSIEAYISQNYIFTFTLHFSYTLSLHYI